MLRRVTGSSDGVKIALMRTGRKTIIGLAVLGLAISGICYAYAAFYDYAEPTNGLTVILIIVCPTQLLFLLCIDCEVIGRGGLIMYSIVGVLNAALYSVIGALVVGLRKTESD